MSPSDLGRRLRATSTGLRRHVRRQWVGYVALFVALGGVSYAASTLPANSVDAAQISAGAVGTSEIHDRSIRTADIRRGAITAALLAPGVVVSGPVGSSGATRPAGLPGPAGANGAAGGTDPSVAAFVGLFHGGGQTGQAVAGAGGGCTLAQIALTAGTTLPAGFIPAHGQLVNIGADAPLFNLVGPAYGGDGQLTFALPDMRPLEPTGMTYGICDAGIFPTGK